MLSDVKALCYLVLDEVTGHRGITRVVCGERIRFPARWSRYYPRTYEPATFAFLRANVAPDSCAIDIGAHLGLFSVLMSRLVGSGGHVHSFEPTPVTRRALAEVLTMNACTNADVRSEAVSDWCGEAQFFDTGTPGSNANSLVASERVASAFSAPVLSVDAFLARHSARVSCIKIDAEGAEVSVLRGAIGTIRSQRPAISLGVHPAAIVRAGSSLENLWAVIRDCDLRVLSAGVPLEHDGFVERRELFDVQLVPAERV
jgi:FkbM family methyltransferase